MERRLHRSSKIQLPTKRPIANLEFDVQCSMFEVGACCFSGSWMLDLGPWILDLFKPLPSPSNIPYPTPPECFLSANTDPAHTRGRQSLAGSARTRANPGDWSYPKIRRRHQDESLRARRHPDEKTNRKR